MAGFDDGVPARVQEGGEQGRAQRRCPSDVIGVEVLPSIIASLRDEHSHLVLEIPYRRLDVKIDPRVQDMLAAAAITAIADVGGGTTGFAIA